MCSSDLIDFWYFCDLPTPRAAKATDLQAILLDLGFEQGPDRGCQLFDSPELAYQEALKKAGENDRITVFGSFYTVAGVMSYRNSKSN